LNSGSEERDHRNGIDINDTLNENRTNSQYDPPDYENSPRISKTIMEAFTGNGPLESQLNAHITGGKTRI